MREDNEDNDKDIDHQHGHDINRQQYCSSPKHDYGGSLTALRRRRASMSDASGSPIDSSTNGNRPRRRQVSSNELLLSLTLLLLSTYSIYTNLSICHY
jgi:hypothetical protein